MNTKGNKRQFGGRPQQSGRPLQPEDDAEGIPRSSRPRDINRMRDFNETQALASGSNNRWAESADATDRGQSRLQQQQRRPQRVGRPPKKATESSKVVESVESPLYDGMARGSRPNYTINSHNIELSTFPILVSQMFNSMLNKDQRLRRAMPFCAFLHYCTEVLNATLLARVIEQNSDTRFEDEQHPYDVLRMDEVLVPKPLALMISAVTNVICQNGERVYINLPNAAVPQHRVTAADITTIESGSFGAADADTHNAYECYVAPLVTRRLVEATREQNAAHHPGEAWNPLPVGQFPAGATPMLNLLGYYTVESLQNESLNVITDLQFTNADTMAGRLSHSAELMNRVRNVLENQTEKFSFVPGPVKAATNPSAIIYTSINYAVPNENRLANSHGGMHSMECFGSSAANMANYFAMKRLRNNRAFGPCYVTANSASPAGWNATANWNYEMHAPYQPVYGHDYPALRTDRFSEEALTGSRTDKAQL